MKNLRNEDKWLLGILAICLVSAFIGLATVPRGENCPHDYQGYPTSESQESPKIGSTLLSVQNATGCTPSAKWCANSPQSDWFSWVERNSGGLQAVFDLILVFVGGLQWLIYRTIRNDSIISNRAFLSMPQINWLSHYDPKKKTYWFEFKPVWKNSGNTQTNSLFITNNFRVESDKIGDDFSFPDKDKIRVPSFIGAKSEIESAAIFLSASELAAVAAGEKFFYIWGRAEYQDVYRGRSDPHITRFCWYVYFIGGNVEQAYDPTSNLIQITWRSHNSYNCTDEDCCG